LNASLIPKAESLTVEFKSDRDKLGDDELIEAVICLANAQGGTLYLGVENDGTVTGLHAQRPQDIQSLAALVANRTAPALAVEVGIVVQDGHRIAEIRVVETSAITARSDGLVKRRRIGGNGQPECVPFLPHEYASRQADFQLIDMSSEPVVSATLDDFDLLQRERLRRIIHSNPRSDKSLVGLSDEQLDGALSLTITRNGVRRPTLIGLLLIGATASLQRLVPTHEVLFQVLSGTSVKVNESSRAALVEIVEWLDLLSRGVNTEQEFNDGLFRIGIGRVDGNALREAINNALVHRDYARRGPVRVCWQDIDLIISNPGGFVEGVTVENLLTTEPRPRNPALADAFKRLGLVDRTGRGVDLIFSGMLRFGRPEPDYSQSMPDLVKLSISTAPADLAFVRMVLQEEARQQGDLPVETLLILTALREARRLSAGELAARLQCSSARASNLMESLSESGLVRAHGQGKSRHFTLSASVYRELGQKAEYVRQAAFEPIQQVQMIKSYLKEHGQIRRSEAANLCQIAPREAGALLERMVRDAEIMLHGQRKAAYYTANKPLKS
jgi:ATP-dependent DNA helicase RecG